jgi:hypothetical protein
MQITPNYSYDSFDLTFNKDEVKLSNLLGTGIKGIYLETEEILCYEDIADHNIAQVNNTRLSNKIVNSLTYTDDHSTTELLYKLKNEPKANGKFQKGQRVDKLIIQLTSKILKQDYFNGINKNNIKDVWEYTQNAGLIMDFETFLNGGIRDLDVKKDSKIDEDEFNNLSEYLRLKTKPSERKEKGYNQFGFKDGKMLKGYETNTGIEFGIRNKYDEYLKFYDKEKQLNTKEMKQFKETYLTNYDIAGIKRLEANIPARIFKNYGIGNSLQNILLVADKQQDKLKNVMTDIITKHIDFNKPIFTAEQKIILGIKNLNVDLYNTIFLCIQLKYNLLQTIDFIFANYKQFEAFHRNTYTTRKKEIKIIYYSIKSANDLMTTIKTSKKNINSKVNFDNINNTLNNFGIDLNTIN